MKSNLCILVFWVFSSLQVCVAVPIPLDAEVSHNKWTLSSFAGRIKAKVGKDQAIQNVNTAVDDAHQQVLAMERVAADPEHPDNRRVLQESFGDNFHEHMPAIRNGIATLKNGHIRVTNVFGSKKDVNAATYLDPLTGDHQISTGYAFHKELGREKRAGLMIHEASHALLGTEDYHAVSHHMHGKLEEVTTREASRRPAHEVKIGYAWSRDYKQVINNHVDPTKNADSWMKFGHHSQHGFDEESPKGKTRERSDSHDSSGSRHHNLPGSSKSGHKHSIASVAAAIHPPTARHLSKPKHK